MEAVRYKYTITKIFMVFLILVSISKAFAQSEIIPIWPDKILGAILNTEYQEIARTQEGFIYNISKVTTPTLVVFLPEIANPTKTAIIICPGGGYAHLSFEKEGAKVAHWLNSLGIAAFVLKYRLPNDLIMKDKAFGPLQDAQEAVRILRRNAEKWKLDVHKIGIMGFSAGGHLAATLSTHYNEKIYEKSDSLSARPDFSILIYPVISMKTEITHTGSQKKLLGETPTDEAIGFFSNELHVNEQTPPAFLVHASDDKSVISENSINYYLALKKHKVNVELHIFEKGGHGFGLGLGETSQYWTSQFENWLRLNLLIE
ncbi:MAG: alpha/beta hydrolase, partial [Bacteroidota bacterium]|jgi:acetyl esterase/lipase